MRNLAAELYRRNKVLAVVGGLHLGLFLLAALLSVVDTRTILGIDAWTKPMKFMASITIYLWTVGWITGYVREWTWSVRVISWGAAAAMIVETVCLWIQSARGATSHFNNATAFDSAIFSIMGVFIILNSLLAAALLVVLCLAKLDLPRVYAVGLRLGLLVFLVGSMEGYVMVANNAHTVGTADGGPGLPFLNWSTEVGDLRVAHLLGLHSLQVIPLCGFAISRWWNTASVTKQVGLLVTIVVAYSAIMGALFAQAMAGHPFIQWVG